MSILRIALTLHSVPKFEPNAVMEQKGVFFMVSLNRLGNRTHMAFDMRQHRGMVAIDKELIAV